MAQKSIFNNFVGKMDMDTNPSLLKEVDYIFAENCRIGYSEEDNIGCVENVKSTLKISNEDIVDESGRYICIGATTYEPTSTVYYFIKDTQESEHGIYELNIITRNIEKIAKGAWLGFTTKILAAVYQNDMLTWTDGNSNTRQLFVKLAKTGWYDNQVKDASTLIKFPPNAPIKAELINGNASATYTLDGRCYQFIYRYIFEGYQKSVWSMPSKMIATGYDKTKKAIKLTLQSSEIVDAGKYKDFIKYVEIGFRIQDDQPFKFFNRFPFPKESGFPMEVEFYNDSIYTAIATNETNRFYDDVPRTSQSLAIMTNRLMLANNKRNFDNVPQIQAVGLSTSEVATLEDNGTYFKSGGSYGIGVVLYDRYQRRSYVYPLGGFTAFQRNGALKATKVSFGLLESSINGLPDWVEYYAICLTKCKNIGKFVQAHVTVVGTPTNQKIIFSPTFVAPSNPQETGWVYTTGDRCNLRATSTGTQLDDTKLLFDIPLQLDSTSGNLFIEWDGVTQLPTVGVATNMIVEFYTPIKTLASDFYYEIGQLNYVQVVDGKKRFGTNYLATGQLIEITFGDTQYRNGTGQSGCEAMSPNDAYFETWCHNLGRPNIVAQEPETELNDTTNISYSNPYILGTNLNGINTFEFESTRTFPIELGDITRILTARDYEINGSILLVVTKFNCFSVYVGKFQITNANGSTQLALTETLLGSYNLLAGGFGSIHPESIHVYGTTVRGVDALKGIVWRYSQDGLTPLSVEYRANAFVTKLAQELLPTKDNPLQTLVGAHDPYFDEYIANFKNLGNNTNKALAFNESKNGFSTLYDIDPDWMATINRSLVFFKNGVAYIGRAGSDYNNLLGKRVTSKLSYVAKMDAPFINLNGISIRIYANDNWAVAVDGIRRTKFKVQKTKMKKGFANNGEDSYMYPISSDENNTVASPMKSRYFKVHMELDENVDYLSVLYGTEMVISQSNPTPKF